MIFPEQQFPNGQTLEETCERAVATFKHLGKIAEGIEIERIVIDQFPNGHGGYNLTVYLSEGPPLQIQSSPVKH